MTDPTHKPGDQKASQEATAQTPVGRSKYIGWLLAYKWPVIGAVAVLLILGIGSYGYLSHQNRPEPSVLLARALEYLADHDNSEAIPEARKIASELDALHYRDPHFVGAVPYLLGITDFRRARLQTDRERLDSLRSAVAAFRTGHGRGIGRGPSARNGFRAGH